MPAYKPDPIQKAIDRVIDAGLEWQKASTHTRCKCGRRANRSEAEVTLSIALDAYKIAEAAKQKRFPSEAPTAKRRVR